MYALEKRSILGIELLWAHVALGLLDVGQRFVELLASLGAQPFGNVVRTRHGGLTAMSGDAVSQRHGTVERLGFPGTNPLERFEGRGHRDGVDRRGHVKRSRAARAR